LLEAFAQQLSFESIASAIRICWDLSDKVRFSGTNPTTFFLTGLYRLMLLAESPVPESGPPAVTGETVQTADSVAKESAAVSFTSDGGTEDLEAELRKLTDS
jgi:hypothetical protein